MGWTYTSRHGLPIKEFLRDQIECDSTTGKWKVLDMTIVHRTTMYAAVEITRPSQPPYVAAFVFLLRYTPKSEYDIGYKDMDESMGPCERECPERILKLLSPLPVGGGGHAEKWRGDCRTNLLKRKILSTKGTRIKLQQPVTFSDGVEGQEFEVIRSGLFRRCTDGQSVRLSRYSQLNSEVM